MGLTAGVPMKSNKVFESVIKSLTPGDPIELEIYNDKHGVRQMSVGRGQSGDSLIGRIWLCVSVPDTAWNRLGPVAVAAMLLRPCCCCCHHAAAVLLRP